MRYKGGINLLFFAKNKMIPLKLTYYVLEGIIGGAYRLINL